MGRRALREKTKPQNIARTIWKTVERTVKRDQLDLIASICGTKREVDGSVISYAIDTNE